MEMAYIPLLRPVHAEPTLGRWRGVTDLWSRLSVNWARLTLRPNVSLEERRPYFEEAARQRNLSPVLLEKDFWVCWLLSVLFSSEFAALGDNLA